MRKMEGEIERLNNVIKTKVEEINVYDQKYRKITT